MIHIRHTYRTSPQSSPWHNQLSPISELLHATLQQNDCTSSSFPINLWPWVNIKVIQTVCKPESLVSVEYHTKFETNRFTSVLTYDNVKCILHKITSAEFFHLNITCAKFHPDQIKNVRENEANTFCFVLIFVTPRQGQGQWKWCKMVEVNCANKHGRYEETWLNSLHVMSIIKVFAMQDSPHQPVKHNSLYRSIWWYSYGSTGAWDASSKSFDQMQSPMQTCETGVGWAALKKQPKNGAGDGLDMSAVCHSALFSEQHYSRCLRRRETEDNWEAPHREKSEEQRTDPLWQPPKQQLRETDGGPLLSPHMPNGK